METERAATQVLEGQIEISLARVREVLATSDPINRYAAGGPYEALAEEGIRALLWCLDECETPSDAILSDTPQRVIAAFYELTEGYRSDGPEILFEKRFPTSTDDLVIVKDIEFVSLCEHHLMPFVGQVHLGYLPDGFVVGLSKFARLVDYYSRRLQIQERLCANIADAIMEYVSSRGAACVVEASHCCLSCRGARQPRANFITSSMHGEFRSNGDLRREFLAAIQLTHSRI